MTRPALPDQNRTKADNNQRKRIASHREWDKLLAVAATDDFDGTITLEVSAKAGRYGRIVRKVISFTDE